MTTNRLMTKGHHPLSLDQIANMAPSALAVRPYAGMSTKYAYIPTVDVIRAMQEAGFLPFFASESRTRQIEKAGYLKHMLRFRSMLDSNRNLAKGDTVAEVILVNSHDGSCRYRLIAGIWRLVCDNGMAVEDGTIETINVRHSGNVIEEVVESSARMFAQLPEVVEKSQTWRTINLSQDEQGIFARSAHQIRFGDAEGKVETTIRPEQLLESRRYEDNGSDLWSTFNRVQENVVKGGLKGDRQRNERGGWLRSESGRAVPRERTREIKAIDQNVNVNKALWKLAEEMAALKRRAA